MPPASGIVGEFLDLKAGTDADLLAMQCGDFYEFFAEDAEVVAEELDLKVSQKSSHGQSYPMAGVPVDDLAPYLTALVERGYRVAVADQYETDDGHARQVVRVASPGTLLEGIDADARYLAAILEGERGYGLAFADVTTGAFLVAEAADREGALSELYRFDPAEVLPGPDARRDEQLLERLEERFGARVTRRDPETFAPGRARSRLGDQFGDETVERLDVGDAAVGAAGAVLAYVEETGVGVLATMTRIRTHQGVDHVTLDGTTQRTLELTETMTGESAGSLLETIDHTVTSAGRRRLTEWLLRPRRDRAELTERHDTVEALATAALGRETIRDDLRTTADLERLAARATRGSADARDLTAVRRTLEALPRIQEVIEGDDVLAGSPLVDRFAALDTERTDQLASLLSSALVDDPPSTVTEGGVIRPEHDETLAAVVEQHERALGWLEDLAGREQREYGLTHVTVDRTATDGYYIQVGRSEADDVPEHYREIKTLKNSKRFRTEELEERERELLELEERRFELEYELFETLRSTVAGRAPLLQDVGRALAAVDALASLATHAAESGWVRPTLVDDGGIEVEAGRHPVVEQAVEFVPNDVTLGPDRDFLIVTGPNMAGKSTYLRQTATIVLLAQIGSFVPATSARIEPVDGIFTRVGALDELAQGRSTFMVEMAELANILHSATADSLVVLDEVGRGTATYDGISIAWAATEYLHNGVGATTLFATHYHELTSLAEHLPRVANVHVAIDERDGEVTFLRAVRPGPADRSYGIHVAELAGVPDPVVDRAETVLERLRTEQAIEARGSGEVVQAVFDVGDGSLERTATTDGGAGSDTAEEVLSELEAISVAEIPPIELASRVEALQRRLADE